MSQVKINRKRYVFFAIFVIMIIIVIVQLQQHNIIIKKTVNRKQLIMKIGKKTITDHSLIIKELKKIKKNIIKSDSVNDYENLLIYMKKNNIEIYEIEESKYKTVLDDDIIDSQ